MAKVKQYKVIDPVGVVGFNGVIHGSGDIISSATVPAANLKAWLRFGQVEEVKAAEDVEKPETGSRKPESKKGGEK